MGPRCLLTKMYPFPQLLASPTVGRLGPLKTENTQRNGDAAGEEKK